MGSSSKPLLRALATLGAAALLSLAWPGAPAHAAPPSVSTSATPTLIVIADAPASRQAVQGLGSRLPAPWRTGDDTAFRKSLSAAGLKTTAGIALGSPGGRATLASKAPSALKSSGARAVLFVRVTPRPKKRAVTLLLCSDDSATPLIDATVEVSAGDDGAGLIPTLTPALDKLAPAPAPDTGAPPPPPAAPSAPADAPTDKPSPSSSSLGGADRAIFVFSAGGGSGARVFRYHDGLTPELRPYDLAASPALVLAAELYPLARTSVPILRGLGLYGGFSRALGVSSETSRGQSVSTSWWRVQGGLRLRIALGEEARFILGLHGGVLEERFGYEGDPALTPYLPDVDYLVGHTGVDGRLRLGPIALTAEASYMPAIKGGAVADRFRKTTFAGVELGFGLAVPIVSIFELRASGTYTRVIYSFEPEVGDVYVAGGALDHLIRAHLLATLLL